MNKTLIVANREYLRVVRKPTFWISTLLFPVMLVVIVLISGLSSMSLEETQTKVQDDLKNLVIIDQSGLINDTVVEQAGYRFSDNVDESIEQVKNDQLSGVIIYPENFIQTKEIKIYGKDLGLLNNQAYGNIAQGLVQASTLASVTNPELAAAFNTTFNYELEAYKEGQKVEAGLEKFIVPFVAVIIYFVLTTFATSYLLLSVSEEKENRAIEIVLSAIKSNQLILGKIIGLVGVVLTQVLLLMALSIVALIVLQNNLQIPIDFSKVDITIWQIIAAIFYAFMSFFVIACTMVGVGAAMPNYKDANSFSAIFIMLSVLPLYFITAIIANPSGPLAVALTYVPFANGIVLLFRSTFGVLDGTETILSAILMIIYALIALVVSFRLFEFGSLEYGRKISFKEAAKAVRKK
jgi:ABC-2 type transport system permease protein